MAKRKIENPVKWTAYQLLLLGIIIGAIIANIIQYPAIDFNMTSVNYPSLKGYDSQDLAEIGRNYSGSFTRARFGAYLGLSQISKGVNVFLPIESSFTNEKLYGLGLIKSVERLNYDPKKLYLEFDLASYEIINFEGSEERGPGKVAVVLGRETPEAFIVLKRDDTWYFVDLDLFPEELLEELL